MKRTLDVIVGTAMLVATVPLLALVALAIRVSMGSPVLFRQPRPGLGGAPFTLLKFRTMVPTNSSDGIRKNSQRLTRLGRWLRATSIDELPSLVNVLKGEMSLVGPRPLRMEYLPHYSVRQRRRHDVKPGVTGWAQVNGRNLVDWSSKFEMDVWYVENQTFLLDLRILLMTVTRVLRREGITSRDEKFVEPFAGVRLND